MQTGPVDDPGRHLWIWIVYGALFGAAIPWYLPAEAAAATWLGFPLWVTISFGASLGVALFTVFVIQRYWTEDE